jgi:hypothetical protein
VAPCWRSRQRLPPPAPARRTPDTASRSSGEVTARTGLILRSAPTRGGAVVRVAPYGEVVKIFCRAEGQSVSGNRQWYLLVDGTWARGSARYIEAYKTPRLCA